jgi:hypothetical protein
VGCKAEAGKQIVLAPSYRFTLLVGGVENMFMPYRVRATHPKQGEIMLRGAMTPPQMLLGRGQRHHLEVQICTRATSAVVATANPTIILTDTTAHSRPIKLPISAMEGIGEGVADLHYGNNIALRTGHRYTVSVTWNEQRVTFRLTARKAQ